MQLSHHEQQEQAEYKAPSSACWFTLRLLRQEREARTSIEQELERMKMEYQSANMFVVFVVSFWLNEL